jgi:hypothetical protein
MRKCGGRRNVVESDWYGRSMKKEEEETSQSGKNEMNDKEAEGK